MLMEISSISETGNDISKITKREIHRRAQAILSANKRLWLYELNRILVGSHVALALEVMFQTRLLGYVLPELFPVTMSQRNQTLATKDLWYHIKTVTANTRGDLIVKWAALLHDIAKPQTYFEDKLTKDVHFYQHEYLGAELAESAMKRLKMEPALRRPIKGLVSLHQRIADVVTRKNNPPVSMNALRRLSIDCEDRDCRIEDLVELFAADCTSGRKDIQERQQAHANLLRKAVIKMREEDARPRLPKGTGEILMSKYNLSPGPKVGRLMADLNKLLQDGKITVDSSIEEMLAKLEEITDEDL
jgi:putative nucleotidyltransferase with HDIG domain